jgi:hypothetical protein
MNLARRLNPSFQAVILALVLREAECRQSRLFGWMRFAFKRVLLCALVLGSIAHSAFASCTSPKNPIEAENCLPGSPSSGWYIAGGGSPNIQGFATDISVNVGQTVFFKVATNASSYRIDIYRLGYYQENNGRLVASIPPSATLPQVQPPCLTDSATGLTDCGNWGISASWTVPSTAVSGIYFARLMRLDTGEATPVLFVVRNDSSHSDILVQTADLSWQAYNIYGGNSLYQANTAGRAYKVSYNRPFNVPNMYGWFFSAEYPMVRWLEANGYDVSYFTGVDTDRNGGLITQHKVFMPVGHDEYWSDGQRANVEGARAAGVNLAFFTGNEIFWKTRWEASIDGTSTPYRTLVCYKETLANAVIDPGDPPTWTGTWRDPRFSPPANGGRPENALTGTSFLVSADATGPRNDPITVPQADGRMRFWRNTSIATLGPGQIATLPAGVLGYEWDTDADNGFRPAGLIPLSTTTLVVPECLLGYTFGSCTATHHLTLYRAPSGALVFGAGTVQWSWGLDINHALAGTPSDLNMQQATVNLLADMGVQPATLQSGLVPTTPSTDTVPPMSVITSPAPGTTIIAGSPVTVSGTAADTGGGVVGAVEVSLDGGKTWHPAAGRENWSYRFTPGDPGTMSIQSRAVDDSGNLEVSRPGITVMAIPQICPCSIWPSMPVPAIADAGAFSPLELGVQFWPDSNGYVTGIRFYKSAANTGTHVGSLWSSSGTLLAGAIFAGETSSGWQQVNFSNPVPVTANTLYVASYHSNVGHFSEDLNYFGAAGVDASPLHAPADGGGHLNGVYTLANTSAFPTQSYYSSNFWVDVVFNPNPGAPTPLSVNTTSLPNGTQSAAYSQSLSAAGGTPPYRWSLIAGTLPSGLILSTSGQISGTPANTGTSNFTVQVTDSSSPAQTAGQALSIAVGTTGGVISGTNDTELSGDYAFTFSGFTGSSGASNVFATVGRFTADGAGNITNGELDTNGIGAGSVLTAQPFTGTYAIGADGSGVMTLNISGGGGAKLAFAMMANGNAQFIRFDAGGGSGTIGSGRMERASTAAYSTAKITGDYAFGAAGLDNLNNRAAIGGRFTSNGTGTLTNPAGDVNAYGSLSPMTFTSANYGVSDTTTGRGALSLAFSFGGAPANLNFVFYVVNTGKLFVIERDLVTNATPLLNGVVLQQQSPAGGFSNASLNGNMVFYVTGLSICANITGASPKAVEGLMAADGNGGLSLTFDENYCRAPNSVTGAQGTYSVASNGRTSIRLGGAAVLGGYLVGSNQSFLFGPDGNVLFGFGEPQATGQLTNGAVMGNYAGAATTPAGFGVVPFSGEFTADGASPNGSFSGVEDIGSPSGPVSGAAFNATYSISSSPTNGRGTVNITSGSGGSAIAYAISPAKFVMVPMNDPNPAVWIFEQAPAFSTLALSSLTLSPASLIGGAQTSTGTVTLSGPAPTGGAQVTLSSSDTAVAGVPSSVTVALGATSATFSISTSAVRASTPVTILASFSGVTQTASLTVNPAPVPPSITTQPKSQTVTVGQTATFTVAATGPAPLAYQWRKNSLAITGATSSSYTTPATTSSENGAQFTVVVGNSAGSVNSTAATLTVNPPPLPTLSSLALSPSSVVGGLQSSTGTVTLNAPAPAGGVQLLLSSSNTGVGSVPSSVTVPAGATSATFTVNTSVVLISTSVTISASYNNTILSATLAVLL